MSSAAWDGRELAELYDRISDLQYERGRRLIEKMQVKKARACSMQDAARGD